MIEITDKNSGKHIFIGTTEQAEKFLSAMNGTGEYDSYPDTLQHIKRVAELLMGACVELMHRANKHDESKLHSPEKEYFDKYTPMLKSLEYGSDEYKESLRLINIGINHHYQHNSHHPEHYINGVNGMNLFDLIEMFMDWKAAGERHGGNIYKSIEINKKRFNMTDQLADIFTNTAKFIGFEFEKAEASSQ